MEKIIYLSLYQVVSDWKLLKANISAVMLRAGQGIWEDPKFREHYAGTIANEIPFGIWWFLQPDMAAAPQIDAFLKIYNSLTIKPKVIALDVEEIDYRDDDGQMKKLFPPSRQFSHNNILAWCAEVQKATRAKVGIYTRKDYFEKWTFNTVEWLDFWLWIAAWYNYTGNVPPALPWLWGDYRIHQYEGGGGGTPGVHPVHTCKEYYTGTHEELLAFFEPAWTEPPPVVETDRLEKLEARVIALENWARSFGA
jgi:GH25 family lysozyme M1 (1,4-beta-N-acetylmuramidase)